MTHDELLAKINELDYVIGTEPSGDKAVLALRAVVELHKPDVSWFDKTEPVCGHCGWGKTEMVYPCPTIQAIEKELK